VSGPSSRSDNGLALEVASSEGHSMVELRGEIDGYSASRLGFVAASGS
jgi:hypothetical protein